MTRYWAVVNGFLCTAENTTDALTSKMHTFGTMLAEAGFSEATIADLMGHADPQTTRRYTHATDRAKRAPVEAVIGPDAADY